MSDDATQPDGAPPSRGRGGGALRRAVGALGALGCAVSVLVWAIGALLSDRAHWSQYAAWVPTWASLGGAGVLWGVWGFARRAGSRWERATGRPRRRRAWGLYAFALVIAAGLAWMVVVEWRVPRGFVTHATSPRGARVLVWNPSWERMSAFHARLLEHDPDVVLVSNPHPHADWSALHAGMGDRTYALRQGMLVVVSRFPIRRFGWTGLRVAPEPGRPSWWKAPRTSASGGEALFVQLDAPALTGNTPGAFDAVAPPAPLTIWFVDLPSDMWIHRERMLREARRAIDAFRGPVLRRSDDGLDVPEQTLRLGPLLPGGGLTVDGAEPAAGFPPPDLVVGDLNTPRGSRSLRHLGAGLTHAHDQAGLGPGVTYPRPLPVVAIDHVFVGPRLRAARFLTADLGVSRHLAQVVDVEAAN
ncbi:MAG: endonuclease/exonuclease/phosphatase family protein [Planctomycetota bacterium]|nr:endonuclease/exonuclease/phosphatase family protein [Planctomycetota bacterium]